MERRSRKDTARLDAYGNVAPQVSHTYAKGGIYTAVVAFKEGTKLLGTVGGRHSGPPEFGRGDHASGLNRSAVPTDAGDADADDYPYRGGHRVGRRHAFIRRVSPRLDHNLYRVTGSHVYASPGSYHVTVIGNADAQPLFPGARRADT